MGLPLKIKNSLPTKAGEEKEYTLDFPATNFFVKIQFTVRKSYLSLLMYEIKRPMI